MREQLTQRHRPFGRPHERLPAASKAVELFHLAQAQARYRAPELWNPMTVMPQAGFDWLCDACLSSGFIKRRAAYDHCVDMQFARQVSQESPLPL